MWFVCTRRFFLQFITHSMKEHLYWNHTESVCKMRILFWKKRRKKIVMQLPFVSFIDITFFLSCIRRPTKNRQSSSNLLLFDITKKSQVNLKCAYVSCSLCCCAMIIHTMIVSLIMVGTGSRTHMPFSHLRISSVFLWAIGFAIIFKRKTHEILNSTVTKTTQWTKQ